MKNFAALLLCGVLTTAFSIPLTAQSYKTNQRSKAIHVVYDDSGSMIMENGVYFDRWGQAKYAMEVFAAMLEEKDTMRVYYMSDFDLEVGGNLNAPAKITISGSEQPGARVSKIHNTVTHDANTSYDAVSKAYADLKSQAADVKWLVVLTDGLFNRLNGQRASDIDVDGFFSQYVRESDVNIILLAMGDEAAQIRADPNRGIFFEQARNNNEILGKITSICNRIFNRNKLNFTNEARREFSFDIPMMELLVFAQGADVKINGIKGDGIYTPSEAVDVRYSETATTNKYEYDINRIIVSRNLTGTIATFRNISKGRYSVDIDGGLTVEVYYKPVVNIGIKLFKGRKEIKTQDIEEGRYQIQYGIVDETGKFFESSLLGKVEYEATAQNGGRIVTIKSGDTISLQEGELAVNVSSQFLEINTAENTATYRVMTPLPFKERFRNCIQKNWYWLRVVLALLLALLLYWLLWGRKKRFPKYMSKKPAIMVETDSNTITKYGSFKIKSSTKWLPQCAETGTIIAAADGKPLPSLRVKALGNNSMEFINTGDFAQERLSGIDFYIDDQPLQEGSSRKKVMRCTAQIKSVYYNAGTAITHTCSLAKKGKKGGRGRK